MFTPIIIHVSKYTPKKKKRERERKVAYFFASGCDIFAKYATLLFPRLQRVQCG
jgi:hypothetical protein